VTLHFLVDEDLPRSTVHALRQAGYEAEDVRDLGLTGHTDQEVFAKAQTLSAALLTGDSDFSNILTFPLGSHAGIIVSRIPDTVSIDTLNRELLAGVSQLSESELVGALVIVEVGQIRIRR
jgi:predicted nuclease of predicted toxin-antitoxin system